MPESGPVVFQSEMKRIVVLLWVCSFILCVRAQGGSLLMRVDGVSVSRSEFMHAYQKDTSVPFNEFLSRYVRVKRWACAARKMGLDTTRTFVGRYSLYERRIRDLAAAPAQDTGRHVGNGSLCMAHLFVRIPQGASYKDMGRLRCQSDSLYQSIRGNGDFVAWIKENKSFLPAGWNVEIQEVIPSRLLACFSSCLDSLGNGTLSEPFLSPVGIHMIQILDPEYGKADTVRVADLRDEAWLLSEYRDGLLVQMLEDSLCKADENVLEKFYKKHRRYYKWRLPHFKGIVLQSSDKIKLEDLGKRLCGYPQEKWLEMIRQLENTDDLSWLNVDYGLFQIGTNACVDKYCFGQGDFRSSADYPYVKVLGKVLKKRPESYLDVYGKVKAGYCKSQLEKEDAFLKKRIKVEINEEVLKTVNNHGAI